MQLMAVGDIGQAGVLLHIISMSRLEPENATNQNQAVVEMTAMERKSKPEKSTVGIQANDWVLYTKSKVNILRCNEE